MATSLYRDTGYTLSHLVEEIKHGKIALPDIQRPFVWSQAKVRDLFDSLYRGYPVGTLMFWETGAEVGTRQVGGGDRERVAKLLIVDGQQRLTSLYAVLAGEPVLTKAFKTQTIQIAFNPEQESFDVADASIRNNPEYLPDVTALWKEGARRRTIRDFLTRLAESRGEEINDDEEEVLETRIDRVYDLQNFRFQVIELTDQADEEQVAEIFVRTNSEGVKLNQSDFILTLMSVHWEQGRRALEDFCRSAVDTSVTGPSAKNAFLDPSPDQLLRAAVGVAFRRGQLRHVYSILRGKDLETGELSGERREAQFVRLQDAQQQVLDLTNWQEFLKCITRAGFRSSRMITSETAVVYTYALWLIGKNDFGVEPTRLRRAIARWFFMAHTTSRYSASSESRFESDLGRISDLPEGDADAFCAELERVIRANFTGDFWEISLPGMLDNSASHSPGLYAYWAALNLLDAELLFSDMRIREMLDPAVKAPRDIERHHLFPKGLLTARGITNRRQVNAIANMAFLDWPENASIGMDDPTDYWPVMTERLDGERLKKQAHWHALPVGWEQLDYPVFLERRRDLIAQVVREGFQVLSETSDSNGASPAGIAELIDLDESQTLEFKTTARWNVRAQKKDKRMEHSVVKTVCGFMNSEGGTLLVGVDDDGEVLGLDDDLQTLGKRDRDGFELFVRQLLDQSLSAQTAGLVRVRFDSVAGRDVCAVSVAPTGNPVFASSPEGNGEATDFWVRDGNATRQLHGEDMIEYQDAHWG